MLRTLVDSPHPGAEHDSVQTSMVAAFPKTTALIEDFARHHNARLGGVTLVRLRPKSAVFNHYDSEPWLAIRDRYHLVVQSPKGSLMQSGKEVVEFHEGDLFFFQNKKMHTAVNPSNEWRVHVIFDMKRASSSPDSEMAS